MTHLRADPTIQAWSCSPNWPPKACRALPPQKARARQAYANQLVDHHLILDLLPPLARAYFARRLPASLSFGQAAILAALGLQQRELDDVAAALGLPASQVLALFNKARPSRRPRRDPPRRCRAGRACAQRLRASWLGGSHTAWSGSQTRWRGAVHAAQAGDGGSGLPIDRVLVLFDAARCSGLRLHPNMYYLSYRAARVSPAVHSGLRHTVLCGTPSCLHMPAPCEAPCSGAALPYAARVCPGLYAPGPRPAWLAERPPSTSARLGDRQFRELQPGLRAQAMRKLHGHLRAAREAAVAATMPAPRETALRPHAGDLDAELDEAAQARGRAAPWRPAYWVTWELAACFGGRPHAAQQVLCHALGCRQEDPQYLSRNLLAPAWVPCFGSRWSSERTRWHVCMDALACVHARPAARPAGAPNQACRVATAPDTCGARAQAVQDAMREALRPEDLAQFAVTGEDADFAEAAGARGPAAGGVVSVRAKAGAAGAAKPGAGDGARPGGAPAMYKRDGKGRRGRGGGNDRGGKKRRL
jgi:hypothetical protein